MKEFKVLVCLLILFMTSCKSSDDEVSFLLLSPNDEVKLTTSSETFSIGFTIIDFESFFDFAKWTRDSLIRRYKKITTEFQPSYFDSAMNHDRHIASLEYLLSQECFSDNCSSKIRKEVLQSVINMQKVKYSEYVYYGRSIRTGVFLMAVILVKERNNSIKFIDTVTLQKALLFLDYDSSDILEFSDLIIEYSEKFITNGK